MCNKKNRLRYPLDKLLLISVKTNIPTVRIIYHHLIRRPSYQSHANWNVGPKIWIIKHSFIVSQTLRCTKIVHSILLLLMRFQQPRNIIKNKQKPLTVRPLDWICYYPCKQSRTPYNNSPKTNKITRRRIGDLIDVTMAAFCARDVNWITRRWLCTQGRCLVTAECVRAPEGLPCSPVFTRQGDVKTAIMAPHLFVHRVARSVLSLLSDSPSSATWMPRFWIF